MITEADIAVQSLNDDAFSHFGVTSHGTYQGAKEGTWNLTHSKATAQGAPRPKYKLFQQSNNVRLSPRQEEPESAEVPGRPISIVNVD